MLQTINRRLEKLRDRDHCIGDAYFRPLESDRTLDALKQVFANKIIPLLQEYFFGDWGKIGLVLGKEFVRRKSDTIDLADFEHDERDALMSRPVYELTPISELTDQSFRRIYEDVPADV
jgi:5-methylcytosine-specific restriction enzyme B